jgi:GNAT superfamily N-acetyltransferase
MSDPIRLRRATPDDAPTLAAFNRAMAQETEARELAPDVVLAGVLGLFARPDAGFYVVAERAEAVVGSLMVTPEWSDWRNGWFWWIQSVYVRPEMRRRGLYRALHEAVRDLARRRPDVRALRLYVERDNAVARRTYEALGMRPTRYLVYEEPIEPPPAAGK